MCLENINLKMLALVILSTLIASTGAAHEDQEPMSASVQSRWLINDGPDDVYIRVLEPLDEWRFYCMDIPGARDNLLGRQLNVHTCKEGMWHRDTIFSQSKSEDGEIYMPEYDLCIEPSGLKENDIARLASCTGADSQKWDLSDGLIRPEGNADLCLTLSTVAGKLTEGGLAYPTGYMSREISLQICRPESAGLQHWVRTKPLVNLASPILPDGSPADWRDWVLDN